MPKTNARRRQKHVGQPCAYCGVPMEAPSHTGDKRRQMSRDHAMRPKAWAGRKPERNIVMCCRACNMEKGSRSLPVWLADLLAVGDPRHRHVAVALRAICDFQPVT